MRAYGYSESPGPPLAAYGVANLLALLPIPLALVTSVSLRAGRPWAHA